MGFINRLRVGALIGKANELSLKGNNDAAIPLYLRAVETAADPRAWLLANGFLAETYEEMGRKSEAVRVLREIVDGVNDATLYRWGTDAIRGAEMRVETLGTLVDLLRDLDDRTTESSALDELAAAAQFTGNRDQRSRALRSKADNQRRLGLHTAAIATLDTAIAEAVRLADGEGEALAQRAAAYIEGRQPGANHRNRAWQGAKRALDLFEQLGDQGDIADSWGQVGRLHRWDRAYDDARVAFLRAAELLRSHGYADGADLAEAEESSLPARRWTDLADLT